MINFSFPIYVGGNCHCGDGSKYDKMWPYQGRLNELLKLAKYHTVILNGDTFDCLEYDPADVFRTWWSYIERIKNSQNIFLTDGNHEIYTQLFTDIFRGKYFQLIPAFNFDIQHGYLQDPMFDTPEERKVIEKVAWLYKSFRNWPYVTDFKEWITSFHHENEPFEKRFLDYHVKTNRQIVMSHTHTPVNFENWFFATGPQLSHLVKITGPDKAEIIDNQ